MGSIAERIREILRARELSERRLAQLAGMTTPSQLNATLKRLEDDPGAVEVNTLYRIADAARVRREWLLSGVGPRDAETRVVREDRYPNRAAAAEFLRDEVDPRAIELVLVDAFSAPVDPPKTFWVDRIRAKDAELKLTVDPAAAAARREAADRDVDAALAEADARSAAAKRGDPLPPAKPRGTRK